MRKDAKYVTLFLAIHAEGVGISYNGLRITFTPLLQETNRVYDEFKIDARSITRLTPLVRLK